MFQELMRKFGWIRTSEFNTANKHHEYKIKALHVDLAVREERIRSLKQHLRAALAPHIAPHVRAHVKGAVVSQHIEHFRMFDVYTIRLPEVVLRCNIDFLLKCHKDSDLAEIVCYEWGREFHALLPEFVRKLRA